jgi:hypothetical protein
MLKLNTNQKSLLFQTKGRYREGETRIAVSRLVRTAEGVGAGNFDQRISGKGENSTR